MKFQEPVNKQCQTKGDMESLAWSNRMLNKKAEVQGAVQLGAYSKKLDGTLGIQEGYGYWPLTPERSSKKWKMPKVLHQSQTLQEWAF